MHAAEQRLLRGFERILAAASLVGVSVVCVASCHSKVPSASDGCSPFDVDASFEDPDAGACQQYRALPCGVPTNTKLAECQGEFAYCESVCDGLVWYSCQIARTVCSFEAGALPGPSIVECSQCFGISGRTPLGVTLGRGVRSRTLPAYFSGMARLEKAAVAAFGDLAKHLTALSAPEDLVFRAHRARHDERRHVRMAERLERAPSFATTRSSDDCEPSAVRRPLRSPVAPPSMRELLLDNAIEGCVFESFAALLAHRQARSARSAAVRRTMRKIAADETRHAALAWDIFAWGLPQLAGDDQVHIRRRLDAALGELLTRAGTRLRRFERLHAGVADAAATERLLGHFSQLVEVEILRVSSECRRCDGSVA